MLLWEYKIQKICYAYICMVIQKNIIENKKIINLNNLRIWENFINVTINV